MLLYAVCWHLTDIEEVKQEIAHYNITTATVRFNGFEISKEVIVKEIIRECFDFGWSVGGIIETQQPKKLWEYVFSLV